jgi:hypothetical protein
MITTELYNGQGLGNQLWVYCITRLIADSKKCNFSILSKNQFKGVEFIDLDFGVDIKDYTPSDGPCDLLPIGINNYYKEKKEIHSVLNIDISRSDDNLFNIDTFTKIDGNLQSTKYISGHRDKILDWIKIKKEALDENALDDNACVVHLRCGDFYAQTDVFVPKSYYLNAMNVVRQKNPNVKFYIVTDQPNIATSLFPGIEIIGSSNLGSNDKMMASHHFGGPVEKDFCLLVNAKYVIIPNSSFSWWAAYLNINAELIIAPKYWSRFNISNGYWATSDMVTDEFMYLDREGNLVSPQECLREKEEFEKTNENIFKLV